MRMVEEHSLDQYINHLAAVDASALPDENDDEHYGDENEAVEQQIWPCDLPDAIIDGAVAGEMAAMVSKEAGTCEGGERP